MPPQLPRLAFRVLSFLDGQVEQAKRERLAPTLELRLELAYLQAISGKPRGAFDAFWRATTGTQGQESAYLEDYCRHRDARASLESIFRLLGVELQSETERFRQAKACYWDLER